MCIHVLASPESGHWKIKRELQHTWPWLGKGDHEVHTQMYSCIEWLITSLALGWEMMSQLPCESSSHIHRHPKENAPLIDLEPVACKPRYRAFQKRKWIIFESISPTQWWITLCKSMDARRKVIVIIIVELVQELWYLLGHLHKFYPCHNVSLVFTS